MRIALVDMPAEICRQWYGSNGTASDGQAIMGLVNQIRESPKFSHIFVCDDCREHSVRKEKYPDYKANREEKPLGLTMEYSMSRAVLMQEGIPVIVERGYEADDVIATLCQRFEGAEGIDEIIIFSPDKDLCQLVTDRVWLWSKKTGMMRPEQVVEKWGLRPEQIPDMLALSGDASDNIPGVPSVGPKTAKKWLQEYGDIFQLHGMRDELSPRYEKLLTEHEENIALWFNLVHVDRHLPLDGFDFESGRLRSPQNAGAGAST